MHEHSKNNHLQAYVYYEKNIRYIVVGNDFTHLEPISWLVV